MLNLNLARRSLADIKNCGIAEVDEVFFRNTEKLHSIPALGVCRGTKTKFICMLFDEVLYTRKRGDDCAAGITAVLATVKHKGLKGYTVLFAMIEPTLLVTMTGVGQLNGNVPGRSGFGATARIAFNFDAILIPAEVAFPVRRSLVDEVVKTLAEQKWGEMLDKELFASVAERL